MIKKITRKILHVIAYNLQLLSILDEVRLHNTHLNQIINSTTKKADYTQALEQIQNFQLTQQLQLDAIQKNLIEAKLELLKRESPSDLNKYEYTAFSQSGEDGIIAEIFSRIGTTNKYFIEFGVENGMECNSTNLLLQGWSGVWIEANSDHFKSIQHTFLKFIQKNKLTLLNELVLPETIEKLFLSVSAPKEPDLLSIDIDSNDFWVWKKIEKFKPRVVLVEYNATFGPETEWTLPYSPENSWPGTILFGASLKSYEKLGKQKGYTLVATNLSGTNAFFVRNDCLGVRFNGKLTSEALYNPPRYSHQLYHSGHPKDKKVFK